MKMSVLKRGTPAPTVGIYQLPVGSVTPEDDVRKVGFEIAVRREIPRNVLRFVCGIALHCVVSLLPPHVI